MSAVKRIGLDGVDDGFFAPARQHPNDNTHKNTARQWCNIGAWIELRRRTKPLTFCKPEESLMHPLRNATNGRDCKSRNDPDDCASNGEADFTAAHQGAHAEGYEKNPQIPVVTQFIDIHV